MKVIRSVSKQCRSYLLRKLLAFEPIEQPTVAVKTRTGVQNLMTGDFMISSKANHELFCLPQPQVQPSHKLSLASWSVRHQKAVFDSGMSGCCDWDVEGGKTAQNCKTLVMYQKVKAEKLRGSKKKEKQRATASWKLVLFSSLTRVWFKVVAEDTWGYTLVLLLY